MKFKNGDIVCMPERLIKHWSSFTSAFDKHANRIGIVLCPSTSSGSLGVNSYDVIFGKDIVKCYEMHLEAVE